MVVQQEDGKVLVCGGFNQVGEQIRTGIARFNEDGSLGSSFGAGALSVTDGKSPWPEVRAVMLQRDGRMVVTGSFTEIEGSVRKNIARLNSDGSLDGGFVFSSTLDPQVMLASMQPDDRLILTGSSGRLLRLEAGDFRGTAPQIAVPLANQIRDASSDVAFAAQVRSLSPVTYQWQFNGMDLPAATNSILTIRNLQYTSMGSYAVVVSNPFGRMLSLPAHLIVKPPPMTTGSLDTRFNTGSGPDGMVLAIVLREDRIFIGGRFTNVDETKRSRVARLFLDGSLDPSFTPNIDLDNSVACLAVQTDGKLLIGGYFAKLGGISRGGFARLNEDGSQDTAFNSSAGTIGPVKSIAIQPDGKIIIGGFFFSVNGGSQTNIARINSDGTLDRGFVSSLDASYKVGAIALQTDGKLLVGHDLQPVLSMSGNRLIRLNPDGSMDEEFDAGVISGVAVSAVVPLNDGKILVGINGPLPDREGKMRCLVRLTSRGELDPEFLIEQRQFRMVGCLHVADNGQILVGGYELRRLNQDAKTTEGNFVVPIDGPGIAALVVQPDRNIILGGPFNGVARMPRKYLARVFGSDQTPSLELLGPFFTRGKFELAVPTYPGTKYFLEYKNALQEARWSPLSILQGDGTFQTVVDSPDGVPGRFYRLRTE